MSEYRWWSYAVHHVQSTCRPLVVNPDTSGIKCAHIVDEKTRKYRKSWRTFFGGRPRGFRFSRQSRSSRVLMFVLILCPVGSLHLDKTVRPRASVFTQILVLHGRQQLRVRENAVSSWRTAQVKWSLKTTSPGTRWWRFNLSSCCRLNVRRCLPWFNHQPPSMSRTAPDPPEIKCFKCFSSTPDFHAVFYVPLVLFSWKLLMKRLSRRTWLTSDSSTKNLQCTDVQLTNCPCCRSDFCRRTSPEDLFNRASEREAAVYLFLFQLHLRIQVEILLCLCH